jgi:glucose-1-phosphate thymidylyltransferase
MTPPRPLVGLIPAAGMGSRLGARSSKELVRIVDPAATSTGTRPVGSLLLDALGAAGIETALVVLRRGKWDIPERLVERADRPPRLAYVVTEATRSIPETLDRARPFLRGRNVLLGFPDVVLQPTTAARTLRDAHHRGAADITLAVFPSDRPDKTDMIELDGDRVTGFRIKPGPCELRHTWLLAAWGERFTDFLGTYLERTGGEPPPGGPLAELQISQVMAAALADGLSIRACTFPEGRFIDVGTPEDLARARREADRG